MTPWNALAIYGLVILGLQAIVGTVCLLVVGSELVGKRWRQRTADRASIARLLEEVKKL